MKLCEFASVNLKSLCSGWTRFFEAVSREPRTRPGHRGFVLWEVKMSKRFTATEKWFDPWFRRLSPIHKCLWLFMCDQCDNAVVWKNDPELAEFVIGAPINSQELSAIFGDRIKQLKDEYWLITRFVDFQYGQLTEASRPHSQVLTLIEKHI